MTKIGDQLRKLAEEADSWPDLTAYACVVTKETALRSFTEFIEREQDARRAALMLLIELVRN
jgi:hypothetical protein